MKKYFYIFLFLCVVSSVSAQNMTESVEQTIQTKAKTEALTDLLQRSKSWQKESVKYLKNKKKPNKLEMLFAVENMEPDSIFFVEMNKNFNRLDNPTKDTVVLWLTSYNTRQKNINSLYLQNKVIEMLYTQKDRDQMLKVGKCLQTYPNELSIMALINLLKSDSMLNIDVAKETLIGMNFPNMEADLRKLLFNNKNIYQKIAILDIFRAKDCAECLPEVIALLNNDDSDEVQSACYQTIASIASADQLETLEVVLKNAPPQYKYLLENKIKELKTK